MGICTVSPRIRYRQSRFAAVLLCFIFAASPGAADTSDTLLTMNFVELPLADALQVIADEMGLNLVLADGLTGSVSLHIEQLPVEQALDMVLFGRELGFRLRGSVLAVAATEHLERQDAELKSREQLLDTLETRFIQLNYADGQAFLQLLLGSDSHPGGGLLSERGSVRVDQRTNTLIVRDTLASLRAVEDLLTVVDVPVKQVRIEARIVSATLDSGRELGVRWGVTASAMPPESADLPVSNLLSLSADHQLASIARGVGVRDHRVLDLEIAALERAGEAELIARPRVTTQDNMAALIQSGVRIPYQAQAGGTAGGSTTEFVDAVLALDVTPLITPDGRIIMRLNIRQDSVASGSGEVPAINTNTINTSVLVNNGETLVLGGIFREESTRAEAVTPGLGRLPLLGGLFRRQTSTQHRTELLIFITPEIVSEVLVQDEFLPP
ncbi:MAG: type IV pilus secretin PilQ [Pseudohongiella sp.]|nr:type IV pilus secretin PilQ [Pseudohongiella sp.]